MHFAVWQVSPLWAGLGILVMVLVTSIRLKMKSRVTLVASTAFMAETFRKCPLAMENFISPFLLSSGVMHTIFLVLFQSIYPNAAAVKVKYNRETITLPDGGLIALDWVDSKLSECSAADVANPVSESPRHFRSALRYLTTAVELDEWPLLRWLLGGLLTVLLFPRKYITTKRVPTETPAIPREKEDEEIKLLEKPVEECPLRLRQTSMSMSLSTRDRALRKSSNSLKLSKSTHTLSKCAVTLPDESLHVVSKTRIPRLCEPSVTVSPNLEIPATTLKRDSDGSTELESIGEQVASPMLNLIGGAFDNQVENEDDIGNEILHKPETDGVVALVVIVPGLMSDSRDIAVKAAALEAVRKGYLVVVVNHRGCGGVPLKTPRPYCGGSTDDLHAALLHASSKVPSIPIVLIGFSLGANIMVKYLGESPKGFGPPPKKVIDAGAQPPGSHVAADSPDHVEDSSPCSTQASNVSPNLLLPVHRDLVADSTRVSSALPIRVAVSISNPLDLAAATSYMQNSRFAFFTKFLGNQMKKFIRKKYTACCCTSGNPKASVKLPEGICFREIDKCKTILDVDRTFTSKAFGYSSPWDYFDMNSSGSYLDGVSVPLLIMHAEDDPMCPSDCIDFFAPIRNPSIAYAIPRGGGHCGFISGSFKAPTFWGAELALQFVSAILVPNMKREWDKERQAEMQTASRD